MIPDVLLAACYLLFARRKFKDYVTRYWYEDRSEKPVPMRANRSEG
jgi:hypothetical protein